MRCRVPSLATALLVGAAAASPSSAQGAQLPPSIELRVPKPPSVGTGDDGSFLVYELHLTNMGAQPVTLKRVDVLTTDATPRVLVSIADSALTRSLVRPGLPMPATDRARVAGGSRAVVYLWVPVTAAGTPASLRNRVVLEEGTGDSVRVTALDGPVVPVTRATMVIGPPLRGGPWLAANGPLNSSGHRRALISINGTPNIAQRFAIDYVKLDDRNSTHQGDSLNNASYFAEGNDALAVVAGRVVAIKDGIPENVPGINSRAVPITLETVGGNHVILDIGGGHYAFYAHFKPGSLRVKIGDQVKRGQVLGLVGNSGNSTEPHLHFHISDGNSPLGSEGIPYVYDSFEIVGNCRTFTSCERSALTVRHGEIPLANTLVRFP